VRFAILAVVTFPLYQAGALSKAPLPLSLAAETLLIFTRRWLIPFVLDDSSRGTIN
jgi:hypothetical protein